MELWTAFAIGILGSVHCVGMCGPIALALPHIHDSRRTLIFSRLLYNAGRTTTYAALGVISGIFGRTISAVGFQQTLSIVLGVIILLAVLLPSKYLRRFMPTMFTAGFMERTKSYWKIINCFLDKKSISNPPRLGVILDS